MREIAERYFKMWLTKNFHGLDEIFADNIYYSECYGPEYVGIDEMWQWINGWLSHGDVLTWDILDFFSSGNKAVARWYFKCNYDGKTDGFDGVTVFEFKDEKIVSLREFQSKSEHIRPYKTAE